jgi:hypothetical protein
MIAWKKNEFALEHSIDSRSKTLIISYIAPFLYHKRRFYE